MGKKSKKKHDWRENLSIRLKERLLDWIEKGGAIIDTRTNEVYCDLRACPNDLNRCPEYFKIYRCEELPSNDVIEKEPA